MSVGVSNYFRSWWSVFDLLMFSMFLLTEILWLSVYAINLFWEYDIHNSNRMCWYWHHPILIGEGIYATASVMAFSRLLLWFQVNSRLGPLGTSIKYMMVNVFQFFMLFFIIMLAFATGINSIYKNYKDSSRVVEDEVLEQPEAFLTLKNTFKNLFWAIFGMGEPDFAQIVVGNMSMNGSNITNEDHEHLFTEGVGYTLWGFYHMVTVVVLLNMLIAMMTESYQRVQTNADMEWKFACSTLWLSIFDYHSVVPPPFNLIPSMHRITIGIRWIITFFKGKENISDVPGKISWSIKRCCYWETEIDYSARKAEEEKYEKLIVQLIRRYLHCKEITSRCTELPNISNDFKDKLKEEITQELGRSLKLYTRRYTRRNRTVRNRKNNEVRGNDVEPNYQNIPPNNCNC
ncbi:Short transient receptor potential channel 4 like protein [Argiope bruennichi]|uniref:Short transient receptor potential channel 4 like protein n=2 Tax=Argiope bruennichi TaxID=94029 RepID=A0A8T0F645_ARGBR|nr:Short transient receptor potential channel 4 like protein [Argiope bruennichi]